MVVYTKFTATAEAEVHSNSTGDCYPVLRYLCDSVLYFCLSFTLDSLSSLGKEINPDSTPTSASKEYRKSVALGLFYKVLNKVFVF